MKSQKSLPQVINEQIRVLSRITKILKFEKRNKRKVHLLTLFIVHMAYLTACTGVLVSEVKKFIDLVFPVKKINEQKLLPQWTETGK